MMKRFKRGEILSTIVHLWTLSVLAFAQPLFDILARNPTFFVANHVANGDIFFLVALLCAMLPSALIIICLAGHTLHRGFGRGVLAVELASLIFVIVLPFGKRLPGLSGPFLLVIAGICGIAYAVCYLRYASIRSYTSALSPAIIIVPGIFLFFSPVKELVFPPKAEITKQGTIEKKIPIVMVVFDEFSLASLMDTTYNIDSARYPNFYALSKNSNWYRNATTVCDVTERIVPSILTGKRPSSEPNILPTRASYPENLLTLLDGIYNLKVLESVTALSAVEYSQSVIKRKSENESWSSLQQDLSTILLHVLLPQEYKTALPPIGKAWGGFVWMDTTGGKIFSREDLWELPNQFRIEKFRIFIDSIKRLEEPTLHFIHTLLPHVPYEYLPSGKKYVANPYDDAEYNLKDEYWNTIDRGLLLESYQRYLLQVGMADRMIGELVTRLKNEGLYDECLLIVTADHGVSFRQHDYRRPLTETNFMDILPVPLFIKMPEQKAGTISDANVELIDILPTIASVLNINIPWKMDGLSIFDERILQRTMKQAINLHRQDVEHIVHEYPSTIKELKQTVRFQSENFGSGSQPGSLYRIGRYRHLIGMPTSDFTIRSSADFIPIINHRNYYESLSLSADPFLTEISGKIRMLSKEVKKDSSFAIIVNDTIQAITGYDDANVGYLEGVVPEEALHGGHNRVDVAILRNPLSPRPTLLRSALSGDYALKTSKWGDELLETPLHEVLPINYVARGALDTIYQSPGGLSGWGWAADVKTGKLPVVFLVFIDGKFHFAGAVGDIPRQDLVQTYHNESLLNAGFSFDFIAERIKQLRNPTLRIFALFEDNEVSELANRTWSKAPPRIAYKNLLQLMAGKHGDRYLLLSGNENKSAIPIQRMLEGNLDILHFSGDKISITGWSADVSRKEPAKTIVVLANGKSIDLIHPTLSRPDIARGYRSPKLLPSGFNAEIFLSQFSNIIDIQRLGIYAVSQDAKSASLLRLPDSSPQFQLAQGPDGTMEIKLPEGPGIPVYADVLSGNLDIAQIVGNQLHLKCWGVETKTSDPADAIVVMIDSKCVVVITPNIERADIVKITGNNSSLRCGVELTIPLASFGRLSPDSNVRFFAVAQGGQGASELTYPSKYPFKR